MNLKDSIAQAVQQIENQEARLAALKMLVENGLEAEPADSNTATFYVLDASAPNAGVTTVYAVRTEGDGWTWHSGNTNTVAVSGHWASLITSVTYGSLYPVAVVLPTATRLIGLGL